MTEAPASASPMAIPSPIPLLAPVTTATFPSIRNWSIKFGVMDHSFLSGCLFAILLTSIFTDLSTMTLLVEVNKTENGKIYESALIQRRWCSLGVILLSRLSVMPKIVFIGAGSTVFAKNLLGDILSIPELSHSEIFLQDIDTSRLETSRIVAEKICSTLEVQPIKESL